MAYNVKGNLSVISNSLYSKYADDQIKKQQANNSLREMFALQDDIQTIKPTLKQFIKRGDPKAILTWTKKYRQTFVEVILNSNLSDANKAKFRKPILPNEKVSFEVKFLNSVRDVYKFEGTCFKENLKVSEAEFSAMITYK